MKEKRLDVIFSYIGTENCCKIKLTLILWMAFRTSLFHLPASNLHQSDILIPN